MRKRKSNLREKLEKKLDHKIPDDKEVDHKKPLKDGGTNSLRNLHAISKKSHARKTAREARKRAK